MNFSQQQADPRRHLVGITVVILFHILVVWALVSGLAKKVVDVVRAPIETKVIEEIKKPPPPPEVVVPPPPRLEAPPPPFIPPPEVQIATPPPAPTITATTPTPPPAPVVIAPPPPPAPVAVAPPPAPKPATTSAAAYCSKMPQPEAPGVDFTGKINLSMKAIIRGNKLEQIELVPGSFSGTNDRKIQRAFVNAVNSVMQEYVCAGDGISIVQPFGFVITN